jgi:hypothetical protein
MTGRISTSVAAQRLNLPAHQGQVIRQGPSAMSKRLVRAVATTKRLVRAVATTKKLVRAVATMTLVHALVRTWIPSAAAGTAALGWTTITAAIALHAWIIAAAAPQLRGWTVVAAVHLAWTVDAVAHRQLHAAAVAATLAVVKRVGDNLTPSLSYWQLVA